MIVEDQKYIMLHFLLSLPNIIYAFLVLVFKTGKRTKPGFGELLENVVDLQSTGILFEV